MGPFSSIQDQINHYFPPDTHPYRTLTSRIKTAIDRPMAILDIGCGHGAPNLRQFVGNGHELYGIDLIDFDADAAEQTQMTLLKQDVSDLKDFEDQSIDLAYSRSVMEHVEHMTGCFNEIARVLKPGGRYIFLTPNRYDYASLIAAMTPNKYHQKVVSATEGRAEIDTFPTFYRANDYRTIHRQAGRVNLSVEHLERLQQYPSYFAFSRPLFWLGVQYERLIGAIPPLDCLKGWILCELRKPTA